MTTRFTTEKKIFKQENRRLGEAKVAAERQLAEEKQVATARLTTEEASMEATAKRECEEEDAMSTQKTDEEQSVLSVVTNLLVVSAAKVEERTDVVEAQNKTGDDAEVQKAEKNVETVFKTEKELAETVAVPAAAETVVAALVESMTFLVTGRATEPIGRRGF